MPAVHLAAHPANRPEAVRGIAVAVNKAGAERLMLAYTIEADPARIRIPAPRASRIGRELWRHTCCECFIAADGHPAYCEYNFSPSHEWALYAFTKYRDGAPVIAEALDPRIEVRRFADRLELSASIPLRALPPPYRRERLSIGLSAVIEDTDGGLSYWALRHPADKPDFHHRDSFTLKL
jgi:hypothetical protein